jgi:hypothetical protein
MASNLTTFALYTPALALIAGGGLPLRQQGLAALTILLITLMVAWVPLALAAVVPGASTRLLPWLGGWMTANNRWIQVVLGFGFGVWLLIQGRQRAVGAEHEGSTSLGRRCARLVSGGGGLPAGLAVGAQVDDRVAGQ